jgi:hypothetical protein
MPRFENKYDVSGHPICRKCERPILPDDSVVLVEDSMIHGACMTGRRSRGPQRLVLSPPGVIDAAPIIAPATEGSRLEERAAEPPSRRSPDITPVRETIAG